MATTGMVPSALAVLALLLGCQCAAAPEDSHSFSLNFIVKGEPVPRQRSPEMQCSMDEVPFLKYSDNKAKPLGALGRKVNDTELWRDLSQRIKYIGEEFEKLLNGQLTTVKSRGHSPFQAKMFCQHEREQLIDAYWQFTNNEQSSFLFYPMNLTWRLINPEAKDMMQKFKDDEDLGKDLEKIAIGDCPYWLKKLSKLYKEISGPTSKFPNTFQLLSTTEPPSTTSLTSTIRLPSPPELPSSSGLSSAAIIVIVVPCISLLVIAILAFVKRSSIRNGIHQCHSSTSSVLISSSLPAVSENALEHCQSPLH